MPSSEISNRWANIGLTTILTLLGCEPKDDMKLATSGQRAEFDGSISSPKAIQKVRFQIERVQLLVQYPNLKKDIELGQVNSQPNLMNQYDLVNLNQYPDFQVWAIGQMDSDICEARFNCDSLMIRINFNSTHALFSKLNHQIELSRLCALYLDTLDRQVLSEGEADHKKALMDDIVKVMIDRLSQPMEGQDFGRCFEIGSPTTPQDLISALTQTLPRLTFEQLLTTYKSATGIHKEAIATEAINRLLSKDQTVSITSENIVEALIGPLESNPDQQLEVLKIYIHSLELHHLARVYIEVENTQVHRLLAEEMLNTEEGRFKKSAFTPAMILLDNFPEMQKAVIEKWKGSLQPEYPDDYAYPPVYYPEKLEEFQEPRRAPEEFQEPRRAPSENNCKYGQDEFGYPPGRCVRPEPILVWSSVL